MCDVTRITARRHTDINFYKYAFWHDSANNPVPGVLCNECASFLKFQLPTTNTHSTPRNGYFVAALH